MRIEFTSFYAGDGVTVFVPEGFRASDHLPSPAFAKELVPAEDGKAHNCALAPQFKRIFGKSIAVIETGDADLYGGGEVNGSLRRNNDKQYFWNTNNPACMVKKGKMMYQSQPFMLGVRIDGSAFGIIADTSWKSRLSTKGRVKFTSEGPLFRVVIIEKDTPQDVVMTLARLSGKMELPPLWALGYQQCRFSYYPQEQAAEVADKMRSLRIPCDVIWMDIDYMDSYKVFTYHPEGYHSPKALNGYLHGKNFKAVYMIDPGVKAEEGYAVDDQGRQNDYYLRDKKGRVFHGKVWPGECHFPDYTREDVCRWWASLYKDFMATGIDGIWNDMNEPTILTSLEGSIPKTVMHKGSVDGIAAGPHLRYRNVYGHYMVRASREGMLAANPDKRPFLLTRAAFLGTQRYAATWTGDNFSDYRPMKDSVPMVLNMGLSGQPFSGPDIGGFMKNCTPELLRHWTASGIYFPFARNHASKETIRQEPWAFDAETLDICRTAIERRYRLLPYFYTVFEEASRTGLPVMRPVFWTDIKDLELRREDQAYMVGHDLLVIPRWCQNPSLPKGDWACFGLEEKDDSYQSYLALRPGAAIPLAQLSQNTEEFDRGTVTFLVNTDADGKASGSLYIDGGDGFEYRKGEFARYEVKVETSDGVATLSLAKIEGKMEGKLSKIRMGLLDGERITYSDFAEADTVSLKVPAASHKGLDTERFRFTELEDYSVNKPVTLMELIKSEIVKEQA